MSLSINDINRLQAENVELKAYKDVNEDFKTAWEELKAENDRLKEKIKNFENKLQLRMANDKESNEYWDDIFSAKDYPFNKENAYKELQDYYFVLKQLPEIYLEITGGILSKTTYFASSVIEAYHDVIDRRDDEIDNLQYKNNEYKQTLQEIKEIAENRTYYIDFTRSKSYLELEQDYAKITNDLENRLFKILQKISEVLK